MIKFYYHAYFLYFEAYNGKSLGLCNAYKVNPVLKSVKNEAKNLNLAWRLIKESVFTGFQSEVSTLKTQNVISFKEDVVEKCFVSLMNLSDKRTKSSFIALFSCSSEVKREFLQTLKILATVKQILNGSDFYNFCGSFLLSMIYKSYLTSHK